jgi:hypothetical protein
MKNRCPGYATISEASTRLGISTQRVHWLLGQGRMPFKVIANHRMVKLSDLEGFASIKRPSCLRRKSPLDDRF